VTFPFRAEGPVEFSAPLPNEVDLIVIGGGVIGVSTALYAARQGLRVVLLEKGRIAAEQSSRNWGWIRVQGRDMAEIPVALESQKFWQDLDAECHGRCGVKTVGVTYVGTSEDEMGRFQGWLDEAKPLGVSSYMMDAQETVRVMGNPQAPWIGALHTPTDMKAEPWVAVPELARLAQDSGATLIEDCAVRTLDRQAGRVTGVVTEQGRIKADRVVLAGGAWSSLFLRRHGVSIPQLSVRSTALATHPLPDVFDGAAGEGRFALRRRDDGGYTVAPGGFSELFIGPDSFRALKHYLPMVVQGGLKMVYHPKAPKGFPDAWDTPRSWTEDDETPFERMRVLDPEPARHKVQELLGYFERFYPQAGPVHAAKSWAGMIDVMPDIVPVVDTVADLPGLTAVTGMCGHGFGIGPAFGKIAVALAMEQDTGHDLSRFRLSRFTDGSKLLPGPSI